MSRTKWVREVLLFHRLTHCLLNPWMDPASQLILLLSGDLESRNQESVEELHPRPIQLATKALLPGDLESRNQELAVELHPKPTQLATKALPPGNQEIYPQSTQLEVSPESRPSSRRRNGIL